MHFPKLRRWMRFYGLLAALLFSSGLACADANFQIWPIYPRLEHTEKATAIWLKNVGTADALVQIRVYKWEQIDGKDSYTEQTDIIASPPIVKIKPGDNNMLRLSRAQALSEGREHAYRIIVDELPITIEAQNASTKARVNFQMRYSIPLFAYGKGLGSGFNEASSKENAKNALAKPLLTWSLQADAQGQTHLFLHNRGLKFARLGSIALSKQGTALGADNKPLSAYVLAQSSTSLPISASLAKQLAHPAMLYGEDSSGIKNTLLEIPYATP